MTGIVSIDIEPGGSATPVGYLGICEIGSDSTIGSPSLIRFRTPLFAGSWDEWTTSCEEDLEVAHSRRSETEIEQLRGRWDISDDIEHHSRLFGFCPLPDPFDQAEFRRPEPRPFGQVWAELAPQLAGKILTAYNANYDKTMLDRLLTLTDPDRPVTTYRWIDGLAVARRYNFWERRYGSPTEVLRRELFERNKHSENDFDYLDESVDDYLDLHQQFLEHQACEAINGRRGERLQDVAIRLNLFPSDHARLRAIAHREWGIGNKALLHDAADDAWANAQVVATALRAEGLPVSAEGLAILDAFIADPNPSIYPEHQPLLAAIEPTDPLCVQFLTNRARAQIDRCIRRICGIQLSPEQWAEVYTVWEAGVRWLLRLTEVSEAELGDALAAEAEQLVGASYSGVTAHQRGKVYANAMSNWIEANRKQLAFKGHSPEQIDSEINRLCDAEELSRIERRHRSYSRRW